MLHTPSRRLRCSKRFLSDGGVEAGAQAQVVAAVVVVVVAEEAEVEAEIEAEIGQAAAEAAAAVEAEVLTSAEDVAGIGADSCISHSCWGQNPSLYTY